MLLNFYRLHIYIVSDTLSQYENYITHVYKNTFIQRVPNSMDYICLIKTHYDILDKNS